MLLTVRRQLYCSQWTVRCKGCRTFLPDASIEVSVGGKKTTIPLRGNINSHVWPEGWTADEQAQGKKDFISALSKLPDMDPQARGIRMAGPTGTPHGVYSYLAPSLDEPHAVMDMTANDQAMLGALNALGRHAQGILNVASPAAGVGEGAFNLRLTNPEEKLWVPAWEYLEPGVGSMDIPDTWKRTTHASFQQNVPLQRAKVYLAKSYSMIPKFQSQVATAIITNLWWAAHVHTACLARACLSSDRGA